MKFEVTIHLLEDSKCSILTKEIEFNSFEDLMSHLSKDLSYGVKNSMIDNVSINILINNYVNNIH